MKTMRSRAQRKKAWKVWARQYSLDQTNQFCPAARKETYAEQHRQPLAREAKALIDEMAGAAAAAARI